MPIAYFSYRLVGVLVHTGSADAGHYYSFIKTSDSADKGVRTQTATANGPPRRDASSGSFLDQEFAPSAAPSANPSTTASPAPSPKTRSEMGHGAGASSWTSATGGWHEFNDTLVKEFDPKDIPRACFGGVEVTEKRENGMIVRSENERHHSAYMLFYERVMSRQDQQRSEEEKAPDEPEAPVDVTPSPASTREREEVESETDDEDMKSVIAETILKDNTELLADYRAFDFDNLTLVWNLVRGGGEGGDDVKQLDADKLAVFVAFKQLVHAVDNDMFPEWLAYIRQRLADSHRLRTWLLETAVRDKEWCLGLLLKCPLPAVRRSWLDTLVHVIREHREGPGELDKYEMLLDGEFPAVDAVGIHGATSDRKEQAQPSDAKAATAGQVPKEAAFPCSSSVMQGRASNMSLAAPPTPKPPSVPPPANYEREKRDRPSKLPHVASCSMNLVSFLIGILPEVKHHHQTYSSYFRLLRDIARIGEEEANFMIRRGMISRLCAFYTDPEPLLNFNLQNGWGGQEPRRVTPPNCKHLAALLAVLTKSSRTDTRAAPAPSDARSTLEQLAVGDREHLLQGVVTRTASDIRDAPLAALMRSQGCIDFVVDIALHWAWGNVELSDRFVDVAISQVTLVFVCALQPVHTI